MFCNLSMTILYVWSIYNNINIPIIIPILLLVRDIALALPKNNILDKLLVLKGLNSYIEFHLGILSCSLLIIYYCLKNNKTINHYLKFYFPSVIIIYILLLIINFFEVVKIGNI